MFAILGTWCLARRWCLLIGNLPFFVLIIGSANKALSLLFVRLSCSSISPAFISVPSIQSFTVRVVWSLGGHSRECWLAKVVHTNDGQPMHRQWAPPCICQPIRCATLRASLPALERSGRLRRAKWNNFSMKCRRDFNRPHIMP